ncbi:FAD-binding oxidoreductase [Chromobacterium subtsugae]|uniref:FAD-binding oxidoreductase n=1 Tax=Chromobacterium subtsugae TaxID=251747 RepID=A0ABS7FIP5_9NEIS|nr:MULTISPECIES: FAD-binding oxidoreductase [Chromobacterium]KUM03809.1 hydroxyacid dehydrogenase [Chromobacterium subtsugae]KZE85526.1 hydroxyacid dehydrogenase [Chromobacterium sp. F49]MBW7568927.1 FAD-binding oxidoreductase [Chromobacterium subtsugae]MBW8289953.1 FAD-binding oxidoreductase [Chromobacterium subtsugae]OBU84762.1 2-hydroxyacid dehydrogenase [Chromobacterium subtsugae]
MNDFLQQLAAIIGPQYILTAAADTAPFTLDWRRRYQGAPLAVALPGSTAEVAELVKLCRARKVAIVPQGGNTSTCGAATPDGSGRQLIVGMRRLRAIRALDGDNNTLTVDAGVTLQEAQQAAEAAGRLFPLALASQGSCQIGGNLSTNAGGVAVLRYGTMRELALGLEVVLPDGRVLDQLQGLRKDTTGLDLKQLFIGAEGQLGLITAATLKLFPLPSAHATAMVGVEDIETAIAWLNRLRHRFGDRLTAFEVMDANCQQVLQRHHPSLMPFSAPWLALIELSDGGDPAELNDALVAWLSAQHMLDGVVAQNETERRKLWTLREEISESQRKDGPSIKHDIAVPTSALPRLVRDCAADLERAFPGVRIVAFGHAGDGNLHYNVSYTRPGNAELFDDEPAVNAIVYDHVYRLDGTLAAEHGVGQLKKDWLVRYKDPLALELMRGIKRALDPDGLMNPGKWL